jgi:HEPN superfamily AbiU2-like protein
MEIEEQSANHVLFKSIGADVSQMHAYWKVYRQVFATNDERIALLNETGSMVFYMLQHLLIDEVTLSICRLTDPAETMRRKNHSIERLVADVQETVTCRLSSDHSFLKKWLLLG